MKKQLLFLSTLRGLGLVSLLTAMGAISGVARAQEDVQRIVAVINDEIVSEYDVNQRLGLIIATTGRLESEEQYQRMREQVVRSLVDEKLQYQEAAEHEIEVDDKEVTQQFGMLAGNNRITPEQFAQSLTQMGTSQDAIMLQLRANIAWRDVVDARLRPLLSIGDAEVNSFLDRLLSNKGQPEYQLSEIFLEVDTLDREDETRKSAERLVAQIRDGVAFQNVASQFSSVATAAVGGDMGWLMRDQINETVMAAVENLIEGGVSDPIRVSGGYYIVQLRDKRKVMSGDPDETVLDLQQLVIAAPAEGLEATMDQINSATAKIRSCRDITDAALAVKAHDFGSLGKIRVGDLPPRLKAMVEDLEENQVSKAVLMENDIRVLVVCGRKETEAREPSFLEIDDFLTNQKLAMMARRYLRDLRRDAIIDYR